MPKTVATPREGGTLTALPFAAQGLSAKIQRGAPVGSRAREA